ncbi:MAG: sulfur carrier protein ThiS [Candidatus Tumulicola sp.]
MKATINGVPRDLPDGLTIGGLLELLGTTASGIAVARNRRVVRRGEYGSDRIVEGDHVEIIKAAAGG